MEHETYVSDTYRMSDALQARGWGARVEYLAGGLWGIVVVPGDGPRLLVSMDPDYPDRDPWIVCVDCQSHPDHGTAEGTRFVPVVEVWADPFARVVDGVSVALHTLRTLPLCGCDDCAQDEEALTMDRTTTDGVWAHGAAVVALLREARRDAAYEYPGFVAVYMPDGRYIATGSNGWDFADVCSADGDALFDQTLTVGLPESGDDSPAVCARAILQALETIGA